MTPDPSSVPCTFISEPTQLSALASAIGSSVALAIDTEVPINGPKAKELRVMSLATRTADGREAAFVIDARDVDPTLLAPILTGATADAWNANFDARVIDAAVWRSADTTAGLGWWDAQLADALIFQGRSGVSWYHGLAWATAHYLGLEALGKGTVQLSYTAFEDLTEEQIAYAAADAVETLWVSDAIRSELTAAGLEEIAEIEMRARPFLDQMERSGLPFDWSGWKAELDGIEVRNRAALTRLADLTGGGQGSLFDETIEPTWNPGSDRMVRQQLNRVSAPEVKAWTSNATGQKRLLDEFDSLTATVLKEIGGSLASALLEYRATSKILTTYGDSIQEHIDPDGRMRPQYLQVVGTNTGRLASRNPNAQNFSPLMKPHFRPETPDRVFVHADLSQAELRFLAQVADDQSLRSAFARGDDVHISTAASMFGFDRDQLAEHDPSRLKHLRQIAKALNFGIAYGTGAAALSRSLTAEGAATTVSEAQELLANYRRTYPGTASWAEMRIAEIEDWSVQTSEVDWTVTMRLARGFKAVDGIRRDFRRSHSRYPSILEISERHPHYPSADQQLLADEVRWLSSYSAPVALLTDGTAFTFSSRTIAGRRQQFNLHLDRLFLSATLAAIRSDSPGLGDVLRRFETENGLHLQRNGVPLPDAELEAQFEERALRHRYIERIRTDLGRDAALPFLQRAARERVKAMVNAWRNAPIQGGVADIMLVAYAEMHRQLLMFPSARPVQTVHDSVVVECDRQDAESVAAGVKTALEAAMLRFCPDVVPKADVDIRASLADDDVLESAGLIA